MVRTRIAPSPSGYPHVGTLYVALFNLAFAQNQKGTFVLRLEDTDISRSKSKYEESIYSLLKWAGINWQEGPDVGGPFAPYKQSERFDIYRKYASDLLAANKAYKCFTTAKELEEIRFLNNKMGIKRGYNRRDRNLSKEELKKFEGKPYVIRMKVPLTGTESFMDLIKGKISIPCKDIDDQIILKSDGTPTYHFANVIDDHLMEISHVIRGEEWVSSTPKHTLLYKAFGWNPPIFVHVPLLMGANKRKLSKRTNPVSIAFYKEYGILPEALVNFLSLIGYSHKDNKEIYSLEDLINKFDISSIRKSNALFDKNKLDWINHHYISKKLTQEELLNRLTSWKFNQSFLTKLLPLVHDRIKSMGDLVEYCDFFFKSDINVDTKQQESTSVRAKEILQVFLWELENYEEFTYNAFQEIAEKLSKGFSLNLKKQIVPILYATFTGKTSGPPLFKSLEILGIHTVRGRALRNIELLGSISNKLSKKLKEEYLTW